METLQQLIDRIPVRHNLASHIMLLGIMQGFFLCLMVFLRARKNRILIFLALSVLFQSLVTLDIYLCYTGLMKYTLSFNDSTEPFVLCIAPTFYFFLFCLLQREKVNLKKHWWHLVLPVGYALLVTPYFVAPLSVKFNAYLGAYPLELPFAKVPDSFRYSYSWIKGPFDWLVLTSFLGYGLLSFKLVWSEWRRKKIVPNHVKTGKYLFSRNSVVILFLVFVFVFFVFYRFDNDSGDHYIGMVQTFITFSITYIILGESRFFEKSWIADKYETLTSSGLQFEAIDSLVNEKRYFESPTASLKDLANQLQTSTNQLSKTINLHTGSNFNDYINQKRVSEAKTRLLNVNFAHLTVEAIGNSVGFNSKSAFYAAFKKYTNTSPSAFLKENKDLTSS
ncbi:helix-turn-helix domain-containing protein [Flagellimonas sp.]|uniref:helix-turn-helix domain-containing protein n=1 Tax=Flagellimonas sp. TaxID=2058762 RepID=UPI003F4A64C9